MSGVCTNPTKWHMCPTKMQISLSIHQSSYCACKVANDSRQTRHLWVDAQADLGSLGTHAISLVIWLRSLFGDQLLNLTIKAKVKMLF